MNQVLNNILEAERGGLLDLGKALRALLDGGAIGGGGGGTPATSTDIREGTSADRFISPASLFEAQAAYTLTDTDLQDIVVNMSYGLNFLLTVGGDRTIANPLNAKPGQSGVIILQQDAAGGRSVSWESNWKFSGNVTPSLPSSPHAWILIHYFVQSPTVIRCSVAGTGGSALNAASVAEIRAGLENLKYISPETLISSRAPVTLLDENTIFIDFADGINFRVTINGNRTIDAPLDQKPGRSGEITIIQGAGGGYTVDWHSDWKTPSGTPALSTTQGSSTTFYYLVESVGNVRLTPQAVPATTTDFWTGISANHFLSPALAFAGHAPVPLDDSETITPNFNAGLVFSVTLGGNRTIANPPIGQQKAGQSGLFYLRQDNVGDRNVAWGTHYQFLGGVTPVLPDNPDEWTVVPYYVLSPGTILCSAIEASLPSIGGGASSAASTAETKHGTLDSKYVSPVSLSGFYSPSILVDGTSITPDMSAGSNFVVTLGGNRTMENIVNQKLGRSGFFIIVQDSVGSRSLIWGNNYYFSAGLPVRPNTPGSWVIIPYFIQEHGIIRCMTPQSSPVPDAASVAQYRAGTSTNTYISPKVAADGGAPVTLTDAPIVAVNFASGINFRLVLGGNRAMANPTGQIAGQSGVFIIRQDPVGGRTLTWGSEYVFETAAPVIPVEPNKHLTVPYLVEWPGVVLCGV